MLQRLLNDAPTDVATIVFKMKHEMDLSDALTELLHYNWNIRTIELSFQAYARDGLITVQQLSGGRAGQRVTMVSRLPGEQSCEVGHNWPTYNRAHMQRMAAWDMGWTDENLSKQCGEWKEDLGNGLVRIRIMIDTIPEFTDFNTIENGVISEHFPDFLPIEVIIPSSCVISVEVPLNQQQLAVKYNFEEDIVFARAKVDAMAVASNRIERNQIVTDFIEFLIIKPTILIYSSKLRTSIYTKMEEFIEWTTTCNDDKYVCYIKDLVGRMNDVLSRILINPL